MRSHSSCVRAGDRIADRTLNSNEPEDTMSTSSTYDNLFVNEQNSQQNMQEMVIRAPAEVDLEALTEKLGAVDGVEVELRAPEDDVPAEGGAPGADQQAVEQQAQTARGWADRVADTMTFGRRQSRGAEAASRQIEQHSRDPPTEGDGSVYHQSKYNSREVSHGLNKVLEKATWGSDEE